MMKIYQMTVGLYDYPEDFLLIKNILKYFSPRINFSWKDVLLKKMI